MTSRYSPRTIKLPFEEGLVLSGNPEDLLVFLKRYTSEIQRSFDKVGNTYSEFITNVEQNVTNVTEVVETIEETVDHSVASEWTGRQNFNELAITSTSNSVAWNLNVAQCAVHVLTENTTIAAPSNQVAGATYVLRVVQAAGVYTLAWNAVFKWGTAGAPSEPAASGDVAIFSFYSNGTYMYGGEFCREEA